MVQMGRPGVVERPGGTPVIPEGSLEMMDEYTKHPGGQKCDAGIQVTNVRGREHLSLRALAALPLPETEFPDYLRSTPHTITWLGLCMFVIGCVSIFAQPVDPWWQKIYGFLAAAALFNTYAFCHFQDGILIRPHPGFWRCIKACSILYLMMCCMLMFQDVHTVRGYLHWLDNELHMGPVVAERSDADDCTIYDPEAEDPWFNIRSRVDIFVICHLFGWISKALVMRDWRFLWINSLLFEWMEVTWAFMLANFNECWWDTWIMDVFGCNLLGMIIGLKMIDYLAIKPMNWTYSEEKCQKGAVTTLANQMRPASVEKYEWPKFLKDARTYCLFMGYVIITQLCDVNVFFLKFVLNMPTSHPIIIARVFFSGLMACPGTRDYYEYMTNPTQARIGQQSWLMIAGLMAECVMYGRWCVETVALQQIEPPKPWIIAVNAALVFLTIVGFFVAWRNGNNAAAVSAKELKSD